MSAYERCLLTGGYKCRVLEGKSRKPRFGVRLREVTVYGRCPQVEFRLHTR